jgi:hypothetical protein
MLLTPSDGCVDKRLCRHHRNRREVFFGVVRQLGVQRRCVSKAQAAQAHRVTIGIGFRHQRGADNSAAAAAIVDHHRLPHGFGEFESDQARDDVGAAAGGEGND